MTPQEIISIKLGTYELASRNAEPNVSILDNAKKLYAWVTKEADDDEAKRIKDRDAQNAEMQKLTAIRQSGSITPFAKPAQDAPF